MVELITKQNQSNADEVKLKDGVEEWLSHKLEAFNAKLDADNSGGAVAAPHSAPKQFPPGQLQPVAATDGPGGSLPGHPQVHIMMQQTPSSTILPNPSFPPLLFPKLQPFQPSGGSGKAPDPPPPNPFALFAAAAAPPAAAQPQGDGRAAKRRRDTLPMDSVAVLRRWFDCHTDHPFPAAGERDSLAQQSGLTAYQVDNWFANARRRIWNR